MKYLYRGHIYEEVNMLEMAFASTNRLSQNENPHSFSSLVDNKSRFELDASEMELDLSKFSKMSRDSSTLHYNGKLGDVLKYPDLFKYYPNAENIRMSLVIDPDGHIKPRLRGMNKNNNNEYYIATSDPNVDEMLDTIEHEIQHFIQHEDGHYTGTNPSRMTDDDVDDIEATYYNMQKQRKIITKKIRNIFKSVAEEAIPNVYLDSFKFVENKDSNGNGIGSGRLFANKSISNEIRSEVGIAYRDMLLDEPELPSLREELIKTTNELIKYAKEHNIQYDDKKTNSYMRAAGEAEAREATNRRKLNKSEREITPVNITDNYPLNRIIKK